jgi:predicted DNA-binding WGR domain protein
MLLIKVDPEAHIDRWYLIVVQPTLLDKSAVICAWGSRRTAYQRSRIFPVATAEEAHALAQKLIEKRIKRGYVPA